MAPASRDDVVCVVGCGYVGLVTAACLAEMGNSVRVLETDPARLNSIRDGRPPIFEPGLDELVGKGANAGRLEATDDAATALDGAGIVFIAVGTPPRADGTADLTQVKTALAAVGAVASDTTVVVIKSTVPPGTTAAIRVPRPLAAPHCTSSHVPSSCARATR